MCVWLRIRKSDTNGGSDNNNLSLKWLKVNIIFNNYDVYLKNNRYLKVKEMNLYKILLSSLPWQPIKNPKNAKMKKIIFFLFDGK